MRVIENAELQLIDADPQWEWIHSRPTGYDEEENRTFGGEIPESSEWLVWYKAIQLPTAATPAWTAIENDAGNAVSASVEDGILTLDDTEADDSLYYSMDLATLDNTTGVEVNARLKINSSSGDRNRGAAISVCDGTRQFIVWLRADGLNVDGERKISVDMTRLRWVNIFTQEDRCVVVVDGVIQQTGMRTDFTSDKKVTFGTWAASAHIARNGGTSSVEWDWFRVRPMPSNVSLEAYELMLNSVSVDLELYDFDEGDYIVYEWDHSDEAVDGEPTLLAIFEGADSVWATAVDGFLIEAQEGGRDGDKIRLKFTYVGGKYVVYDEDAYPDAYGGSYLTYDEYMDETGTTGEGTTTLKRIGVLADEAYE